MAEQREYAIRPTAAQATEQYSDIALTGLFNAHMAQINSEWQAIWQRYNVRRTAEGLFLLTALSPESAFFLLWL